VFFEKGTPLEVGYQGAFLVNIERFLTERAAGLSNGVNHFSPANLLVNRN
jgi:hypothetical protein